MGAIKDTFRAVRLIPDYLAGLVGSVEGLAQSVQEGQQRLPETHALAERVEAIERAQTRILGEVEVLVDRAESKLAAARGAEERARGMERRAEEHRAAVEGDEEGAEPLDALRAHFQAGNGDRGGEGGVRDVPEDVGPPLTGKAAARAFKWGGVI